MIIAGEVDELAELKMMMYEGEIHALPNVYCIHIWSDFLYDWFIGKPMATESVYIDVSGRGSKAGPLHAQHLVISARLIGLSGRIQYACQCF